MIEEVRRTDMNVPQIGPSGLDCFESLFDPRPEVVAISSRPFGPYRAIP
jgi:hypothetical protein